jgi:hypothetical protein
MCRVNTFFTPVAFVFFIKPKIYQPPLIFPLSYVRIFSIALCSQVYCLQVYKMLSRINGAISHKQVLITVSLCFRTLQTTDSEPMGSKCSGIQSASSSLQKNSNFPLLYVVKTGSYTEQRKQKTI